MLEWLKNKENAGEGSKVTDATNTDDIELKAKDVKEKLDKIDTLGTELASLKEKTGVLDRMSNFLDELDEARKKQVTTESTKTQADREQELQEEFLLDPVNAMRKANQPIVEAQINLASRLALKELVEDNPEEFEFMGDPTIRKEVEAHLYNLPIQSRTNSEAIRNCYYVAKGRHEKDIKEGKVKSLLSAASSSGNGTGNPNVNAEEKVVLTADQKRAAKAFGMSEDEYAKAAKETSYV